MRSLFWEALEIAADLLGATDRGWRPGSGCRSLVTPHHGRLDSSRTAACTAS